MKMQRFVDARREAIGIMMRCTGSMRALAAAAGVSHSNISKWLIGEPYLSEESVARLEVVIGLDHGRPIEGLVHQWHLKAKSEDVIHGLQFLFPRGAKGYTRWVPGIGGGMVRVHALNLSDGPLPYVFTDGRYHVFVRRTNVRPRVFHAALRRVVDLQTFTGPEMCGPPWTGGTPTLAYIRRLPGVPITANVDDLLAAIQARRMSIEQAIEKLNA